MFIVRQNISASATVRPSDGVLMVCGQQLSSIAQRNKICQALASRAILRGFEGRRRYGNRKRCKKVKKKKNFKRQRGVEREREVE